MGPEVTAFRDVAVIVVALAAALSVVVVALVERIAEAQRFSAKLLAERAEAAAIIRSDQRERKALS
jgi:hypothetical protein